MLVLLTRHLFCDVVGFLAFGCEIKTYGTCSAGRLPSGVQATPLALPSRPRPPRRLTDDHFA